MNLRRCYIRFTNKKTFKNISSRVANTVNAEWKEIMSQLFEKQTKIWSEFAIAEPIKYLHKSL
jgi:hypothetical protein